MTGTLQTAAEECAREIGELPGGSTRTARAAIIQRAMEKVYWDVRAAGQEDLVHEIHYAAQNNVAEAHHEEISRMGKSGDAMQAHYEEQLQSWKTGEHFRRLREKSLHKELHDLNNTLCVAILEKDRAQDILQAALGDYDTAAGSGPNAKCKECRAPTTIQGICQGRFDPSCWRYTARQLLSRATL